MFGLVISVSMHAPVYVYSTAGVLFSTHTVILFILTVLVLQLSSCWLTCIVHVWSYTWWSVVYSTSTYHNLFIGNSPVGASRPCFTGGVLVSFLSSVVGRVGSLSYLRVNRMDRDTQSRGKFVIHHLNESITSLLTHVLS